MKAITTDKAPKVVGPYSQAIIHNGFIFCAGQIGVDPTTGALEIGIEKQMERVIANIQGILKEAGVDLKNVIKSEVFLKNMSDYTLMNEIYAKNFTSQPLPARTTVEVSKLPKDALVEIACIAALA